MRYDMKELERFNRELQEETKRNAMAAASMRRLAGMREGQLADAQEEIQHAREAEDSAKKAAADAVHATAEVREELNRAVEVATKNREDAVATADRLRRELEEAKQKAEEHARAEEQLRLDTERSSKMLEEENARLRQENADIVAQLAKEREEKERSDRQNRLRRTESLVDKMKTLKHDLERIQADALLEETKYKRAHEELQQTFTQLDNASFNAVHVSDSLALVNRAQEAVKNLESKYDVAQKLWEKSAEPGLASSDSNVIDMAQPVVPQMLLKVWKTAKESLEKEDEPLFQRVFKAYTEAVACYKVRQHIEMQEALGRAEELRQQLEQAPHQQRPELAEQRRAIQAEILRLQEELEARRAEQERLQEQIKESERKKKRAEQISKTLLKSSIIGAAAALAVLLLWRLVRGPSASASAKLQERQRTQGLRGMTAKQISAALTETTRALDRAKQEENRAGQMLKEFKERQAQAVTAASEAGTSASKASSNYNDLAATKGVAKHQLDDAAGALQRASNDLAVRNSERIGYEKSVVAANAKAEQASLEASKAANNSKKLGAEASELTNKEDRAAAEAKAAAQKLREAELSASAARDEAQKAAAAKAQAKAELEKAQKAFVDANQRWEERIAAEAKAAYTQAAAAAKHDATNKKAGELSSKLAEVRKQVATAQATEKTALDCADAARKEAKDASTKKLQAESALNQLRKGEEAADRKHAEARRELEAATKRAIDAESKAVQANTRLDEARRSLSNLNEQVSDLAKELQQATSNREAKNQELVNVQNIERQFNERNKKAARFQRELDEDDRKLEASARGVVQPQTALPAASSSVSAGPAGVAAAARTAATKALAKAPAGGNSNAVKRK